MISKPSLFAEGARRRGITDLRTSQQTTAADGLSLRENANQRPARWRFRTEIAHETILRPNLDVAGGVARTVNQNGAHRRSVGIGHRELLEPVIAHELLPRLLRQ